MALESDRILEEMVRRLVAAFDPDHIYLYCSRARGEAGPDSDYALMLVVSTSQVPRYRRDQQAFRALCGLGVSKGVTVLTKEEFEAGRKVICSLRQRCSGRGGSSMQPEKLGPRCVQG